MRATVGPLEPRRMWLAALGQRWAVPALASAAVFAIAGANWRGALAAALTLAASGWWTWCERRGARAEQAAVEADFGGDDLETLSSIDDELRLEALPYLRQGLNEVSAQKVCEIVRKITDVDAVAITDTEKILGFVGVGCSRHKPGGPILTEGTRVVLNSGRMRIVSDPHILTCDSPDCPHPLKSAVITPLKFRGRVVGTFKLYRTSPQAMPPFVVRLAVGIAQLLAILMELAEADRQKELVTKARLEALQAQIRPHFLFNVLNTIILFSRTDVERARALLVELASFFRRALSHRENVIPLQEEIEYVNTYLTLERARFGDRLDVRVKVDPKALGQLIPVLTLQPLVENAVVHGLAPREEAGVVAVIARKLRDEVRVTIIDNGTGMDRKRVREVLQEGVGSGMGLGLSNVNDRLVHMYGERYALRIKSRPGRGTAVRMRVPLQRRVEAV